MYPDLRPCAAGRLLLMAQICMRESRHDLRPCDYMTLHLLCSDEPSFFDGCTFSATRAASVKASFTPLFFIAEHSVSRSAREGAVARRGAGEEKVAYPGIAQRVSSLRLRDRRHRPARVCPVRRPLQMRPFRRPRQDADRT